MDNEQLMDGIMKMDSEAIEFKSTQKIVFPPMSAKLRGRQRNLNRARDQLNIYLNILGFGKGGSRKYKVPAVEPEGWPDEVSFINFEHPSYAKLNTVNTVIESILSFHGYDANDHTSLDAEVEEEKQVSLEPPRKRQKRNIVEQNNRNVVEVAGNVGSELSAYEKLRQANINEREAEMECIGVVPHNRVRQERENSD